MEASKDLVKALMNEKGGLLTILKQSIAKPTETDQITHRLTDLSPSKVPLFLKKSQDPSNKLPRSIAPS